MTHGEALLLNPGDVVQIADAPFDDSSEGLSEYENVWGKQCEVRSVDATSDYVVRVKNPGGRDLQFHYEEIKFVCDKAIVDAISIGDGVDIKLLFGGEI